MEKNFWINFILETWCMRRYSFILHTKHHPITLTMLKMHCLPCVQHLSIICVDVLYYEWGVCPQSKLNNRRFALFWWFSWASCFFFLQKSWFVLFKLNIWIYKLIRLHLLTLGHHEHGIPQYNFNNFSVNLARKVVKKWVQIYHMHLLQTQGSAFM